MKLGAWALGFSLATGCAASDDSVRTELTLAHEADSKNDWIWGKSLLAIGDVVDFAEEHLLRSPTDDVASGAAAFAKGTVSVVESTPWSIYMEDTYRFSFDTAQSFQFSTEGIDTDADMRITMGYGEKGDSYKRHVELGWFGTNYFRTIEFDFLSNRIVVDGWLSYDEPKILNVLRDGGEVSVSVFPVNNHSWTESLEGDYRYRLSFKCQDCSW